MKKIYVTKCNYIISDEPLYMKEKYWLLGDSLVYWKDRVETYRIYTLNLNYLVKVFDVDIPFSIDVVNGRKRFTCCRVEINNGSLKLFAVKGKNKNYPVLDINNANGFRFKCFTMDQIFNIVKNVENS